MKTHLLLLSSLGALAVSACETTDFQKYNPFLKKQAGPETMADVHLREDRGDITPLSTGTGYGLGNQSVDVFEAQSEMSYDHGGYDIPQQMGGGMPNYSGNIPSGDPSVEIFSLEGPPPTMMNGGYGGQQMAPNNYGGGYGGNTYNSGNQVFFKHGSSRLGGGDMRTLSGTADQAKFAPVNRVTVAGHASRPTQAGSQTVEGNILNLKESMNRAFAVSKTLMQKGVPAEKIKTVGWGSTKATGSDQQDRRVDVIMGEQ